MAHIFDSAKLTAKQAHTAMQLLDTEHLKKEGYRIMDIFKYEGRFFMGAYDEWVLTFVKNNPKGGDFGLYLQQHAQEVILQYVLK